MDKFLAVDTSSRYLTVLVQNGEKFVLRHTDDCAMRHSVVLMDEIDAAFAQAGLKPADCDFFAAVTGPGSFTGIRIGVATVKGFALACNKPLCGVTSFELIAYNVADENFCVAIDAAHSHYYVCGFNGRKEITLQPAYMSGEQLEGLGLPVYGFEALPLKNYKKIELDGCLHAAICRGERRLSDDIRATYVRKSQAEEARIENKGMEV